MKRERPDGRVGSGTRVESIVPAAIDIETDDAVVAISVEASAGKNFAIRLDQDGANLSVQCVFWIEGSVEASFAIQPGNAAPDDAVDAREVTAGENFSVRLN